MKKVFLVLAAGIIITSCNEADKTADANATSSATASNSTISPDSLNKSNAASNAASNSAAQQPAVDTANLTTIQWLDGGEKDFGKIKEGENLDVSFRFKNTGNKPLVISNVSASCGCTIPETPKKPYAPGETGVIKASFNSTGKAGLQSKQVNVHANTNPEMTTLVFRVEVKPKTK